MVAVVVRLFFRALFLFCVATDNAFSRQGNAATDGQGLLNMLGIKPGVPYTPLETDTVEAKASDYMIQLFLKLAKPSGEVINPGAVKGNHVHGFIANGESICFGNLGWLENVCHTYAKLGHVTWHGCKIKLALFSTKSKSASFCLNSYELINRPDWPHDIS